MTQRIKQVFALVFTMLISASTQAATQNVTIYSYHNHPPFVTGEQQGLTFDLAKKLNAEAQGALNFTVKIVPRSRLNHYIKDWIAGTCPAENCNDRWMVPWVNPKWGFIRGERDNYQWQELFTDSNSIVFRSDSQLSYQTPQSLVGLNFGGIRGHRYVGIDDLVNKGKINRIDGNYERDNLIKLLHKRIDATLLPTSAMKYLLKNDETIADSAESLKIANTKHQIYKRFLMMPENRKDLADLAIRVQLKSWLAVQ